MTDCPGRWLSEMNVMLNGAGNAADKADLPALEILR
jgi:hypothetical protein